MRQHTDYAVNLPVGEYRGTFVCVDFEINPQPSLIWVFDTEDDHRVTHHTGASEKARSIMMSCMNAETVADAIGCKVLLDVIHHNDWASVRSVKMPS